MITSLTDLGPQARAVAERYLQTESSRLPADLRSAVIDELTAHLCERLSPDATAAAVERLVADAGPVGGRTDRPWYDRLVAGFRLRGADERIAATWWDPANPRLLLPRAIGLGWDINFGAIAVRLGLIEPDAEAIPFSSTSEAAFRTALALPAGLAAATVLHYLVRGRSLPDPLPSHWTWDGTPDRWTPKRRAAAVDLATTLGPAAVAAWAATSRRSKPGRAGVLAEATLLAAVGASTTVARSLGARRRGWLQPAMLLCSLGAAAAVLLWLARAGRDEEIARDLGSGTSSAPPGRTSPHPDDTDGRPGV
ncbi:MAG: DUF1648 domain-containing protein [Propionicimonas sp.]|nr:DUF1648 domain-containing protein [Propionicimonas sp.]